MLLYGLLNWGQAHLMPTWLMQEQRLAQVKISQSRMQQSSDSAAANACSTAVILLQAMHAALTWF